MKKLWSILLVAAIICTSLTACQNAAPPASSQTTAIGQSAAQASEPPAAQPAPQEDKQVSYPLQPKDPNISMWINLPAAMGQNMSTMAEHPVLMEAMKNTGVNVEYLHPAAGQQKEQLNLLVASGDMPDIMVIQNWYSGGSSAGVDEGLFQDLTDLVPELAPDYYRAITNNELAYRLSTTNDNRITSFVQLKPSAPAFWRINFTEDVVKKYGLEQQMPVTIEDYTELMERMKADDMAGFMPAANAKGQVDLFMWPYGITKDFHLGAQGEVRFGAYTPEYRDYLTTMHDWFAKGYIHKDFTGNMTEQDQWAYWSNGQVGFIMQSVNVAFREMRDKGKVSHSANYPRLTPGQEIPFENVYWDKIPFDNQDTVINAKSKNIETAIQYLNYFYTEEGATLLNYGLEGIGWEKGADGKKQFTEQAKQIQLENKVWGLRVHFYPKLADADVECNINTCGNADDYANRMRHSDDKTVNNSRVLPNFMLSLKASTDRSAIMRDVNTYVDEMTMKFIVGATPLSEFDNYMAQLKAMGVEDAIAITRSEYTAFMEKPIPDFIKK